ncbi:MAG: HAMP domain-containing sensor histidine kinase [Pseudomonadota bacterium]
MMARLRALLAVDASKADGPGAPPLMETDAEGRVVAANAAARSYFERDPVGRDAATLFDGEAREAAAMALAYPHAEAARPIRAGLAARAGAACDIFITPAPDGRSGAVVTVVDRTADAAREEALRTALAEARSEAAEAKREAKARADLLADLGHEMRTPLNAVIGFAGAMRNETFGPLGHEKYDEYAGYIGASGGHLLDLVSSILDLAKYEADRLVLEPKLTDLAPLARECAAMVRQAADEAGLKLLVQVQPDLPATYVDPRAARQVLINLLSNAVKFTADGEVALDMRRSDDAGAIVVTVRDTGVGMSPEELARLGARFTAAQGPGVRGAKGAGLGLALAHALAEAQGGSLKIASAPGEGVTATVRIPIVAAPCRVARRRDDASEPAAPSGPAVEVPLQSQLDRIEAYRRELQRERRAGGQAAA